MCQALQPGCFSAAINGGEPRNWLELTYFSFVLLSSTGIGDIMPLAPHARALAALEMFTGVMYFALIASRLVGMTVVKTERLTPGERSRRNQNARPHSTAA